MSCSLNEGNCCALASSDCWQQILYCRYALCDPTEDNGAASREFVEKHSQFNEKSDLAYSEIKDRISTAFGGSRAGKSQWHKMS